MTPLTTPVAFIVFKRPEKTARVFEAIRQARPKQLFIIADGPRNVEEKIKTDAVRAITENIDWDCEVKRLYQEKNLGVKYGPPAGISWVFTHVDRCIFLEDDCLPDPTFFPYCTELLERYESDDRVMLISGDNFQQKNKYFNCPESYYFSVSPNLWGWASWRRAWQKFEEEPMSSWPEFKNSETFKQIFPDGAVREWWSILFERNWLKTVNTWEGPWLYVCIKVGLCINPVTNLVSNIGHDEEGAHWKQGLSPKDEKANLPRIPVTFPLIHPKMVQANQGADAHSFKVQQNINRYFEQKVRWFFRSRFPRLYRLLKSSLHR
ncbi:MAG: methyltransferase FkbM [Parcubacteria group bacterium]|nr:methyltransferase FkbM [Parcubacteria group bacterium]